MNFDHIRDIKPDTSLYPLNSVERGIALALCAQAYKEGTRVQLTSERRAVQNSWDDWRSSFAPSFAGAITHYRAYKEPVRTEKVEWHLSGPAVGAFVYTDRVKALNEAKDCFGWVKLEKVTIYLEDGVEVRREGGFS